MCRALTFLLTYVFLMIATTACDLQKQSKPNIEAVVFDFSGVIAKGNREEVVRFIADRLGITQEQVEYVLHEEKKFLKLNSDETDFWENYAAQTGIKLPPHWISDLRETKFTSLKTIPLMLNIVRCLKEKKIRVALLSNVNAANAMIKKRLGYYSLFDPLLLSYQTGLQKPDPQAYRLLLERLSLPAEKVLFIDNKAANVAAAQALGMDAILFESAPRLVEEFAKRGISIKECLISEIEEP